MMLALQFGNAALFTVQMIVEVSTFYYNYYNVVNYVWYYTLLPEDADI